MFTARPPIFLLSRRLYQFSSFGADTMAQSLDNWGGSSPGGGFGANLFTDGNVFTDVLQVCTLGTAVCNSHQLATRYR